LLATLAWLGPHAQAVLPEIEALRVPHGGLPKKRLMDVDTAVAEIRGCGPDDKTCADTCCTLGSTGSWAFGSRRGAEPVEATVFEDHSGELITFKDYFRRHPAIVVFFYTRCDNPLKCSLTITKLARIQQLLMAQGLGEHIRTAAITYDPAFDVAERLRGYAQNRGVRLDTHHRMLRTTQGFDTLRRHFKLGVNFIQSLVNRHRIEVYILDAEGRIAASFERIHWDEQQVVDRAIELLKENNEPKNPDASAVPLVTAARGKTASSSLAFGTLASVGAAFVPKCPVCWAAYFSVCGIAGLHQIPYTPWLQPALVAVMLINLASVWWRGRATGRMSGFYLVSAGALVIVASTQGLGWENAAVWGVALTLAGSLISALHPKWTTLSRARSLPSS
jgi:protein SCO1/2